MDLAAFLEKCINHFPEAMCGYMIYFLTGKIEAVMIKLVDRLERIEGEVAKCPKKTI